MSVARNINIEELIKAETALELQLINEPEFRKGLIWGTPRFGHPEGTIVLHINEVLNNILRKWSRRSQVYFLPDL